MRGGAIPLLGWGSLLLVLYAIDWVWEGRLIQVGPTAFAILVIYGWAVILWRRRAAAIRRGPPSPSADPDMLPTASAGAVLLGLAVACILFGLVWAQFLIFFGFGGLVLALGRVGVERRDQRRARARALQETR